MKKRILILLIFTFFIFSCKNNIEPKKEINVENKELMIKVYIKIMKIKKYLKKQLICQFWKIFIIY